jgi:Kef-type K+ transport system membrane component KefB
VLSATVEMTLFVLLVAILAGPILAAKMRIPGLLGVIFLGILFGPFGFGWLGRLDLVVDLGAVGILYLMFLAGLGFNLNAFAENRTSALVFGLLSFVLPFGLSVVASLAILDVGVLGALLLGSMWASNTLVAYPDVRAAGLEGTRAVRDAVSGGVVADVLSLLVLAVATSYASIETVDPSSPVQQAPTLPLVLSLPLLVGFALWVLPRVGEWFFTRIGQTRVQRVLFSLAAMSFGAALAVAAGLEGIIGAFLAGIGLNRLIPNHSELMERIDFVGSSIFIPAFLVSIGLRIDPAALVDPATIALGILFTALIVVGKAAAVIVAARFVHYSFDEGGLITALSLGQAASTLAIGQVGLELGLLSQQVVNASVLTVVIAALLTSFSTQFFIRRLPAPDATVATVGERVLVDVRSAGSALPAVVRFAGRVARGDDGVSIPFVVAARGDKQAGRDRVAEAEAAARAAGYDSSGIVRLSDSFADGALELVDEIDATMVVLAWSGPKPGSDTLFGNELDRVGGGSSVFAAAVHLPRPWDRVIAVPWTGSVKWHTDDARLTLTVATRLRGREQTPLLVIANDPSLVEEHLGTGAGYEAVAATVPADTLLDILRPDDVVVAPSYLLPEMPVPLRLRLATRLADHDLVIVAGPGRLAVAPRSTSHATEGILGPQL